MAFQVTAFRSKQSAIVEISSVHTTIKCPIVQRTRLTLPNLPRVEQEHAEIAWYLYELQRQSDQFDLVLSDVVYTEYWSAINRISTPELGTLEDFIELLQQKLDDKLESPPDTQTILDMPLQ